MSVERSDEALQNVLDWALERMKKNGYKIVSKVAIASDPTLNIMGYAKKKDGIRYVVVADWAEAAPFADESLNVVRAFRHGSGQLSSLVDRPACQWIGATRRDSVCP